MSKRSHLKSAEESLYASLRESATSDEQLKNRILKAIAEVQSALEIIRKRERNKYHHDLGEDEDMWVG